MGTSCLEISICRKKRTLSTSAVDQGASKPRVAALSGSTKSPEILVSEVARWGNLAADVEARRVSVARARSERTWLLIHLYAYVDTFSTSTS